MKLKNLVSQRFKENPSDAQIASHALMVRGGYMKYVGNGIFSEYPILRRITAFSANIPSFAGSPPRSRRSSVRR